MTRPLRILHCFRSPVGGVFRHVRDLAEEQSKAGHEVGILCDSLTGGEHEDRLFDDIAPFLALGIVRLPIRRQITLTDATTLWSSYKEIKSLRPDVLHGHGAKGGLLARVLGSILRVNRYRVARLYTAHGGSLHFPRRSFQGVLVHSLERMLEFLTDGLIFICDFERRTYEAKIGKPRTRSVMIYNGISERDFRIIPTRSDSVHFVYIGMLRDLKGPDLFVDAFAKTERRIGRPLSALMIGDGPDRDKYHRMMVERGLGHRIGMLPAMRVQEAFAVSQNVVVPSRAEAMPYIVLEALAAGKTVIASRVGGVAEALGDNSPALAKPEDADDLSRIMAEAITEPLWGARNMPDIGTIRSIFSASAMARDTLHLYQNILGLDSDG
ncbi:MULTISPECIES: glycosyltransferase family 4 protein [Rhizobium]|jgi:glycosyltransferase involved in cell wall biosynthesis|uniref:Glycosyltransferase involved in cell wall biosynthesis n=1 Tax=Rhizobium miluonense TaxID=411945 RepID=A0ABU1SKR3_9HYPH|nr:MULTISPECIES: glycosyltransferase family 4 protein [Rhizobium]MBB3425411.1 glycosyltransferase involved in cell wall biosynthesis [Rhizobium sp. BK312]MBB3568674.1 glycosyltransferase involved in cell wall biosynthesis [Rhizobium sp. BK491]MDR6899571.1 glycosyltransferase involved in cell wall biosynthesis [Rhizobium miluonense]